jgi:serine/threonine-protein kinase
MSDALPSIILPPTIDRAMAMVEANGWIPRPTLERARDETLQASPGADALVFLQHLLNSHLLTKHQGIDLRNLIQHQGAMPQFTFLRKLGAGGMGTVFLIEDGGRQLALKTINARLQSSDDFVGRFQRETSALTGLNHPHIAGISSSGESQGVVYMAMEYVDGPSLAVMLNDAKALPETYVLHIARQVADGLNYAWQHAQLVHRDIKPENVLVRRSATPNADPYSLDDVAKLIDFGLAKPSQSDTDLRLTQTGMTIGTPLYMSPEQIRGEDLDCRSDIYGLAATIYHLLTGQTPFTGNSPGMIMSAHLTQPVPDPGERVPSLLPMTRDLVKTGMAKKAKDRFQSHEAFIRVLDEALDEALRRQGSGPRLVRKPLVLDKPPLKHDTTKQMRSVSPQESRQDISARIAISQKASEQAQPGDQPGTNAAVLPSLRESPVGTQSRTPGSRPAIPPPPRDATPASGSPAIRKPTATSPAATPARAADPAEDEAYADALDGAILHEDPEQQLSIGLTPWLVLAGAVTLLAGYLLLLAIGVIG